MFGCRVNWNRAAPFLESGMERFHSSWLLNQTLPYFTTAFVKSACPDQRRRAPLSLWLARVRRRRAARPAPAPCGLDPAALPCCVPASPLQRAQGPSAGRAGRARGAQLHSRAEGRLRRGGRPQPRKGRPWPWPMGLLGRAMGAAGAAHSYTTGTDGFAECLKHSANP